MQSNQLKPQIGIGWMVKTDKGTFFNISIKAAELKKLYVDINGEVHITTAEIKSPPSDSKHTHIVYEDKGKVERQKSKNENKFTAQS